VLNNNNNNNTTHVECKNKGDSNNNKSFSKYVSKIPGNHEVKEL